MVDASTTNPPECGEPAGHMGWLNCPVHRPDLGQFWSQVPTLRLDTIKRTVGILSGMKRFELMQHAATGDLHRDLEEISAGLDHLQDA